MDCLFTWSAYIDLVPIFKPVSVLSSILPLSITWQGAKKGPAAKQAPAAKKTGLSKQSTLRQRREEGSSGRAKATLQLEAHDPFDYFD